MTREEFNKAMYDTKKEIVLKNLHKLLSLVKGYPEYEDCISYAIEELEQEPVLDKIRAEIKALPTEHTAYGYDSAEELWTLKLISSDSVLEVIDKYKAENEE